MDLIDVLRDMPENVYFGSDCYAVVNPDNPNEAFTGRTSYITDHVSSTRWNNSSFRPIIFKNGALYERRDDAGWGGSWGYSGPFHQMSPSKHKELLLKLFVK